MIVDYVEALSELDKHATVSPMVSNERVLMIVRFTVRNSNASVANIPSSI